MRAGKIGLGAVMVALLAGNLYSAETLSEAFRNGKLDVGFKSIYFDVDKAAKGHESILSLGAMLHYTTDPLYGVSLGLRFKSSNSPWATESEKAFYKFDLYGPGAVIEELYLKYQLKKSTLKVGRQFISTPLLASNGSRLVHESFQGLTADLKVIPKTRVYLGYINRYLTRTNFLTSSSIAIGTFSKNIFMYGKKYAYRMGDGVWTALLVNKSVPHLKLTAQYLRVKDAIANKTNVPVGDISVALLQADYRLPIKKGFKLIAGAQYGSSNVDEDESRSGDLLGFRIGTAYKGLVATLGYVMDDKDKGMVSGVGISSNWAYAGDIVGLENYNRDVDTLSLNLKYNFAKVSVKGLVILGRYSKYISGSNSTLNGGEDFNAYDFVAKYSFGGALKGLSTKLLYENVDFDSGAVVNYRLYFNYKFNLL